MIVKTKAGISRRNALATAGAAGVLASGLVPGRGYAQAARTTTVNLQLGWLASGNQIGEIVAKHMGYYEEEKINLVIHPGGPTIDGVAIVASGRFEIGQVSSSPSLMHAVSKNIPVSCFAVGAQEHPFTYFSLSKKPVRTPKDLIGKKVGTQATAKILLSAMLKKNGIAEKDVEAVVIGSDMTPILTGQVDVITGWLTNTTALKPLEGQRVDLRLWDSGVQLYALPFYATQDTLQKKAEALQGFVRATARGWQYAQANMEKAVDFLVKEYPNLVKKDEMDAAPVMLKFAFTAATKSRGWGTMDMAVWSEQVKLYNELGEFGSSGPPALDKLATLSILNATAAQRPKL